MRNPAYVVTAGVCALLMAACGGIPSSGSPLPAAPARDDDPRPHVIGTRPGPQPDATPVEILEGFIAAMEFYEPPRGYPTAAEFLTAEAASEWVEPLNEIVIYDEDPVVEVDGNVATLSVGVTATYDRTNGFVRYPESADPVTYTFALERVGGQWRLADAPDGLLIQETAFRNDFESYDLYFYNRSFDRTTLVPEPIYLPRTANLETLLVQRLLEGPSDWLVPAVRTAFPAGTQLEPPSVPVSDGAARVTLSEAALEYEDGTPTTPEERQLMVEQIVHTLGDQRTVDRVSVSAPRATLLSGTEENPYMEVEDSSAPGLAERLYTVSESGVLTGSSQADITPVTGPFGDEPGLQEAAIDRSHQTAAAVNENDELVLAELTGDGEVRSLLSQAGGAFGSPAWDSSGLLWVIEREPGDPGNETAEGEPGGESDAGEGGQAGDEGQDGADEQAEEKPEGDSGNRLLVIDPATDEVHPVTPPTPDDAQIERFAIAPDGTRIAYVADGRVFEAIVVRDPDRPVDPGTVDVRRSRELYIDGITEPVGDLAWHGGAELALLTVPEDSGDEPIEAGPRTGTGTVDAGAHVVPRSELAVESTRGVENGDSIAASVGGDRLAVGTSDDVVWIRSSTVRWVTLEGVTTPAFAG